MLYIAAPYTHPDPLVRRARAHCAAVLTAELMRGATGDWFFSPIPLGHEVAQHLPYETAANHEFWMRWCRNALEEANALYLLPLVGWRGSRGVAEELTYCDSKSLPVIYVDCGKWVTRYLTHNVMRPQTPLQEQIYWEWDALAESMEVGKRFRSQGIESWRWNWTVQELATDYKTANKEAHNG